MFQAKLKAFLKNKTLISCLILLLIYLMSGYCKWIEIAMPVFAFFMFFCLPVQSCFCIYLFLHCFTLSNITYESTFVATTAIFAVIMFIRYLIGVKRGQYKIHLALFISVICFDLFGLVVSLFFPIKIGAIAYLTYLPIFYCAFAMRKDLDVHQIMNYFLLGFILSCTLSLFTFVLPKYQYSCLYERRFTAFVNHPNYLYMRALLIITYYIYAFSTQKIKMWQFFAIYLLSAAAILATLSKTGIVLLALFSIIFLVLFLKQNTKKRLVYFLIFLLILAILLAVSWRFVLQIFNRFATNNGNFLNSLLTGRDDIWKDYLIATVDSPIGFLFGHGMFSEEVFIHAQQTARASHNLYIFLLYRFGLVGIVALGFIAYLFIREIKVKPTFASSLPLIWFLLESLCDNTFKCVNMMLLMVCMMILFAKEKEKTQG